MAIPAFLMGADGKKGMGRRQCTHEHKLKPLRWKSRELAGFGRKDKIPPKTVRTWIGISVDEAHRMKDSDVKWNENYYPLIEARMSRGDCIAWMEKRQYPRAPRSACLGCPFHTNEEWREVRKEPDEWQDTCRVDDIFRRQTSKYNSNIGASQYLHSSMVPLRDADIDAETKNQMDLWGNECEGMCGV